MPQMRQDKTDATKSKEMNDLTGQQFGRLTAIAFKGKRHYAPMWSCVCECGTQHVASGYDLISGHSQSCGCLMREIARRTIRSAIAANVTHGNTSREGETPEYRSWNAMKRRCNNPNDDRYKDYGGRGITVCDRWRDFANFLADMGKRPAGTSLDRINNDGNYEPSNCRWATYKQQQRNGRRVKIVERNGIVGPFRDVCDALGVSPHLVTTRLRRGWNENDAWTRPAQTRLAKRRKRKQETQ